MMKTKEIAEFFGTKLFGNGNEEISRVASLETAQMGDIAFVEKAENPIDTNASCLLVPENFDAEVPCAFIKVKNPKLAFAKIAEKLYPSDWKTIWHETASVHDKFSESSQMILSAPLSASEKTLISAKVHRFSTVLKSEIM